MVFQNNEDSRLTSLREKSTPEPIAIIGIGCRFPGANGPEAFWSLLRNGVDAITEVPPDRFDVNAVYDPRPATPGKIVTRWGGFLDHVDQFDFSFFGLSPREAARMDPQQRLLLEVAWEALEDAGQVLERLAGSRTGVFIGVCSGDYEYMLHRDPAGIDIYTITGNTRSVIAGRLSYALDLQGPSVAVDTACSSSLVAVHLACQSLWNGESHLALAGGVNLILSPGLTLGFSQAKMMAPDGRCKVFDARGDGFVRSDGVGVVLLKPLSLAQADLDPIYAVIRGSAVNNDGRSSGLLMMPGLGSQEAVLREAYRNAGISPGTVHYVEAHGTGTTVGDPVEVQALGAVLAEGRPKDRPCAIGSVKTNIGHAEGAAGIAGLIKAALCLMHREIPASLHLQEPNPKIPWQELPLVVQRELGPWPVDCSPARAGVSSLGISGTNAHVVLEEAPHPSRPPQESPNPSIKAHLMPLCARSPEALAALARAYQAFVGEEGEGAGPSLHDLCYTAGVRRTHHDYRLAMVIHSREELNGGLEAFLRGEIRAGLSSGRKEPDRGLRIAFVFPGQGPQWWAMGRELLEQEPAFRGVIEQCEKLLRRHAEWSLLEELTANESRSRLHQTEVAQPAIFALQVALAALWGSWGIMADAVVGHSVGEVAAACVAGALSLEDAIRVVFHRGRVMQRMAGQGKMVAVNLSLEEAEQALAGYDEHLSVAASNSPKMTVLSGDPAALEEVLRGLRERQISFSVLPVNYAFHSPQMESLPSELVKALPDLHPCGASIPLYSTVVGHVANGQDFDAGYWGRHLRKPVRFSAAVESMVKDGHDIFLELSPHPTLLSAISQSLRQCGREGTVLPSLRRGEEDRAVMLGSLGALYACGYPVDWSRLYPSGGECIRLPSYPWQRERCWVEITETDNWQQGWWSRRGETWRPLLGQPLKTAHPVWEIELDRRSFPYLEDHRIQGAVLLPATAFIEMALAAAAETFGTQPCALSGIEFQKALFLPESSTRIVQLVLSPDSEGGGSFSVYSRLEDTAQSKEMWTSYVTGRIRLEQLDSTFCDQKPSPFDVILARCLGEISGKDFYCDLRERGFEFGPSFQGIEQIWRGEGEALGHLRVPEAMESQVESYQFHPAIFDACLQVLGAAIPLELMRDGREGPYLPVSIETVRVYGRPGLSLWSHARLRSEANQIGRVLEAEVRVFDEDGRVVAEVLGLRLQRLDHGGASVIRENPDDWLYEVEWVPRARPDGRRAAERAALAATRGSWLIFADSGDIGNALADLLRAQGERCLLVAPGEACELANEGEFFRIHPGRPEEMQQLLEAALGPDQLPCRGVIHFWSLDALHSVESTLASLEATQTLGSVSVLHLVQALVGSGWNRLPRLWLVTRGAQDVGTGEAFISIAQSPVWGLARVIALEHPELRCTTVDLSPSVASRKFVHYSPTQYGALLNPLPLGEGKFLSEPLNQDTSIPREEMQALFQELWSDDREDQLALRGGERYVARLVRSSRRTIQMSEHATTADEKRLVVPTHQPFRLEVSTPGLLEELTVRPTRRRAPGPGEVEIQVSFTGLNFRDIMKAMGIYPADHDDVMWLGDECAGKISALGEGVEGFEIGDEVIAIAPASFSSFATTLACFVVKKPVFLSDEEAVTIPIAFTTAYYALRELARLSKGERVLIHAAAGGVGLAAVQTAQWIGAEIFATAGSPEKREFLRSLGVEHVMDSRSLAFADEVMALTGGKGVDVVLNSLAGEALSRSLSILGVGGRFLEIGKRDIYQNSKLGLRPFQNNLSFFAISMDQLYRHRPGAAASLLREIMQLFQEGTFRPLRHRVFPIEEVVSAFRYMAQAKQIGKIVVSFPTHGFDASSFEAAGIVRSDSTYLITGGLGSLGLLIAQWMVQRGARYVVLLGRSSPSTAAIDAIESMKSGGARVEVAQADVSQEQDVAKVLAEIARSMPPLKGIIHAAGVLDDGILLNLSQERFSAVMAPKISGAWNLHAQTATIPLDFFVLFSSAASLLGSPGQGNYAAANAFLDALARQRRAQGLPALSINWGPWAEIGMAARPDRGGRLAVRGLGKITPSQGLEILERVLDYDSAQIGVLPINWEQWCEAYPVARESSLLSQVVRETQADFAGEKASVVRDSLLTAHPEERQGILEAYIQKELARVLQLDPSRLDVKRPLNTVGLDSLMSIELKTRIETGLGVVLPMINLLQGPSISQLARQLLGLLEEPPGHSSGAQDRKADVQLPPTRDVIPEEAEQLLARLDQLSDDEVDSLLGEMLDGKDHQ